MADVAYNFYGNIINNGTLNGDIINPTYHCNGEIPEHFEVDDIFNGNMGGINERSQFWLLLVAAMARGARFKNIPDFVEKAFEKFNINLDKEGCQRSTQEKLKSESYTAVKDQESMVKFISNICKQPNEKANNLRIANNLFVALKDFDWV